MIEIEDDFVYIHKMELDDLKRGKLCFAYLQAEGKSEDFNIIQSSSLSFLFKIDENKYEVVINNSI